jgi:hypothetical protein
VIRIRRSAISIPTQRLGKCRQKLSNVFSKVHRSHGRRGRGVCPRISRGPSTGLAEASEGTRVKDRLLEIAEEERRARGMIDERTGQAPAFSRSTTESERIRGSTGNSSRLAARKAIHHLAMRSRLGFLSKPAGFIYSSLRLPSSVEEV